MLAYFSRQRVVGAMIVVLACTLCVTPIFSRGKGASAAPAGSSDVVTHVAHYPPTQPETLPLPVAPLAVPGGGVYPPPIYSALRPGTIIPPATPAAIVPQPTSDQIVESKAFSLISTKYRLSTGKARALAQFLDEQIGRPEIFEISEEPEAITIVASPIAQKTVEELVALMRQRSSPSRPRDLPAPTAAEKP